MAKTLQGDTKWGGLKAGQVMAEPKPIFGRIENKKEEEEGVKVPQNNPKQKKVKASW